MKKKNEKPGSADEMRKEYDLYSLGPGTRGKYLARYRAGTNLVLLSPDVAKHFPDERSVNAALRSLITDGKKSRRRVS
jgi:hypothetical protein